MGKTTKHMILLVSFHWNGGGGGGGDRDGEKCRFANQNAQKKIDLKKNDNAQTVPEQWTYENGYRAETEAHIKTNKTKKKNFNQAKNPERLFQTYRT